MNDFRIARNDDETFTDEDTFVSERRDELVADWMKDRKRVADALTAAMENGFPGLEKFLAEFFCALGEPTGRDVSCDAYYLQGCLLQAIRTRIFTEAEDKAQHEWSTRQTGPDDH